jgi:hypothetical protein
MHLSVLDGNLNLHSWKNRDGGDLLDNLRWRVQVNQTLVNTHLESIPGLTSFSVGGFSGGDTQELGWHTDWALDLQVLLLGSSDEIGTD